MRKLIYLMNTSLDGYVESSDGSFDWGTHDAELLQHYNDLYAVMTTHLYGRRMWETMSGYWPTAQADPAATPEMNEFARYWNAASTSSSPAHYSRSIMAHVSSATMPLKPCDG